MVRWNDVEIYDEGQDDFPTMALATGAGLACQVQDCFGFYIKNRQIAGEELIHMYRCRQVKVDKRVGSGENIIHEQRLFAYRRNAALPWTTPQDIEVSHQQVGVVGVDYQFIGWAKTDASETDETVLVNWDGTRPEIGY